jgi:hypothetical protein
VGEVPRFRAHFARGKKTMTKVNKFLAKLGKQRFLLFHVPPDLFLYVILLKLVVVASCMSFFI